MKLFIDENISRLVVERLRQDGHDLVLAQMVAHGRQDRELLALSLQLGAIVVTEDTDFGELVMRERLPSVGVVLLRLSGMRRSLQPDYIAQTMTTYASSLPGSFTVVTRSAVRIRSLP